MSYQVFARKYRPRTFADVLGQDHVVQTLRNAIEQERLAHAYLFVGPRGTGKTSTARIFAKALNCPGGPKVEFDPDDPACVEIAEGNSLDVLEIDGASNNGVEQVRELRETVKFAPAHSKYKIYYIDEVHMLSTAAFNALLKTLEEPPPHVKFIFATTEANKILPTIISRCQRFDLRRIPAPVIAEQLQHIARLEGLQLDPAAAYAVAKGADGGMRDAQSMLDQLVAFCGNAIREEDVLEIFGFTSMDLIADLAEAILQRETVTALGRVHEQSERGKDLSRLMGDLIGYLRNLLVAQVAAGQEFQDLAPEVVERLRGQTKLTTPDRLLNLIDHFAETEGKMKWAANKELHFEIGLIKGMQILSETNLSDVIGILRQAGEGAGGLPAHPVVSASKSAEADRRGPAGGGNRSGGGAGNGAGKTSLRADASGSGPEELVRPAAGAGEGPAPAGDLRGGELWAAVMEEIVREKPLMAGWAKPAVFLEEKLKHLVVGLAPEHSFSRDSLMRDKTRDYIEGLIRRFGGRSLGLVCELREGLPAGGAEEEEPEEEERAEPAPVFPQGKKEKDGRATDAGAGRGRAKRPPETGKTGRESQGPEAVPVLKAEKEAEPEPSKSGTDLRDDELIQEALRLFEGELES